MLAPVPPAPIRALVVAHDWIMRELLGVVLVSGGADVVSHAPSGAMATRIARELRPDVVVVVLGDDCAFDAALLQALRREAPGAKLVGLSAHRGLAWVGRAFDAGASAYVIDDDAADCDLAQALAAVLAGGVFVSPGVAGGAAFAADVGRARHRENPDVHARA